MILHARNIPGGIFTYKNLRKPVTPKISYDIPSPWMLGLASVSGTDLCFRQEEKREAKLPLVSQAWGGMANSHAIPDPSGWAMSSGSPWTLQKRS